MCSETIAAIGLGAQGVGSIVNGVGNVSSGNAQSKMYEYQSDLASKNAEIARTQKRLALENAKIGNEEIEDKGLIMSGKGQTSYAAGNVMLGTGSAQDWQEDLDKQIGYDKAKNSYNAQVQAWAYENEANSLDAQSRIYSDAAGNAATNGWLSGAGTTLSGAGSAGVGYWNVFGKK